MNLWWNNLMKKPIDENDEIIASSGKRDHWYRKSKRHKWKLDVMKRKIVNWNKILWMRKIDVNTTHLSRASKAFIDGNEMIVCLCGVCERLSWNEEKRKRQKYKDRQCERRYDLVWKENKSRMNKISFIIPIGCSNCKVLPVLQKYLYEKNLYLVVVS